MRYFNARCYSGENILFHRWMISTESSRHLTFVKYGVIVVKTYYFIEG